MLRKFDIKEMDKKELESFSEDINIALAGIFINIFSLDEVINKLYKEKKITKKEYLLALQIMGSVFGGAVAGGLAEALYPEEKDKISELRTKFKEWIIKTNKAKVVSDEFLWEKEKL